MKNYDMDLIILEAKKELARREFFYFCNTLYPKDYNEDRHHLVTLCNEMQNFYESDEEVLIVNMPPRHYKTRTGNLFVPWVLGKNKNEKIMTASYNEILSTNSSRSTRGLITEQKADEEKVVYSDIFPDVRIKKGEGAMNLWSLEGGYNNYLATAPGGTATGFGATLLFVDDLIKNSEEANNENTLEKQWSWFTDTMLSRLEEGGKIIIIMTRWHTNDLAGRMLEYCKEQGWKYRHISMKALQDDGTMLCPSILSKTTYLKKTKAMGADIASANYQQIPIDIKGKLYSSFKTYENIPTDVHGNPLFTGIYSYCDSADSGNDYLVNIIWGAYNKEAYILDVIYTKEDMEVTEEMVAKALNELNVNEARFEANHGASAFPRAIGKILDDKYKSNKTYISWFHQSKNKIARIISNATWVMNHIYFPVNWRDKWPEFYKAMTTYQKEGKNAHDDAPDAVTGVAETMYNLGA